MHDDASSNVNTLFCEPNLNEMECGVDQLNIENNEHDVNCEEETLHHSPPSGNITINLEDFKAFSNEKSNACFWQEYICQNHNQMHGGLRGVVWRSMFRRHCYDHTKITTIPDAMLLFSMTRHVMNNTSEQNDSFLTL